MKGVSLGREEEGKGRMVLRYVCVLIGMIRQEGKIDNAGEWVSIG